MRRSLRRRLAVLSLSAAAAVAAGCVTPVGGYGSGYYDRGYYGGGRYYEPRRTVVVRPAPVVVRRPVVRYERPRHRHPKREWVRHHRNDRRERYERHDRRDRRERVDRSWWRGADWRRHR